VQQNNYVFLGEREFLDPFNKGKSERKIELPAHAS